MTSLTRRALADYMTSLLSEGRVVFSRQEAQKALALNRRAFLDAAERQQRRGRLLTPRRGFYVVVPPQYLAWGAPPPSWYIDSLMRHEGRPYYVGLLKAAELHGATHQAVMVFQVVTDKRLPEIRAGRSTIEFHFRKDMAAVEHALIRKNTEAGSMRISSVELTMFDLVRYPHAAGGLDHLSTALADLAEGTNPRLLSELSSAFFRSVGQRLGYLLDYLGHGRAADELHQAVWLRGPKLMPWAELDPSLAGDPDLATEPIERNERWRVIVRRAPEPDA